MSLLDQLRSCGLTVDAGPELHVVGPASVLAEYREMIRGHRNDLVDALQDEAEDNIVNWPPAYQHWLLQTIGLALREGRARQAAFWTAYRDLRAALDADRVRVIAEAPEDGTHRAALSSALVTVDEVAAAGGAIVEDARGGTTGD